MGIVVRAVTNSGHRCRMRSLLFFSSVATAYGSPWLLLPPGVGIKNKGKDMLLFHLPKEEKLGQEATKLGGGYHHFLDMGKNPPRICDLYINTRTMWRGRYLSPEKGLANCVGSSRGWAAFLDGETCDFYLFNFWIPKKSFCFPNIPLPPIETLPTILSRETFEGGTWTRLEELKNLSDIPLSDTRFFCPLQTNAVSSEELSQDFIKRLALSRAPTPLSYTKNNNNNNIDEEEEEERGAPTPTPVVMIIHGYREQGGQLAFCRLGDAAWTSLNHNNSTTSRCFLYEDITYFTPHGKFYALTKSYNLEAWDIDLSPPRVEILKTPCIRSLVYGHDDENEHERKMYLVESEGKLVMVVEYHNNSKSWFDVFVLMEPKELLQDSSRNSEWEWMKITSLNGQILFVGINDSVSLPSHEFPGLIPNSIYFATSFNPNKDIFLRGDEAIGVYDLKDQTVSRFMDNDNITPFPTWIFRSK